MRLSFAKNSWGLSGPLPDVLDRIADAGYDTFETPLPVGMGETERLRAEVEKRGLGLIGQAFSHAAEALPDIFRRAAAAGCRLVVLQGGGDRMDREAGRAFIEHALTAAKVTGVKVAYETHRGRLFYAPWVTAAYLREFPEVRTCLDLSHWTVVTESLLEESDEDVALAVSRAAHIHARVGSEQSAQVDDPFLPEWEEHRERFFAHWKAAILAAAARGEEVFTVNPEYSLSPYPGPAGRIGAEHRIRPVSSYDPWPVALRIVEEFKARFGTEITA